MKKKEPPVDHAGDEELGRFALVMRELRTKNPMVYEALMAIARSVEKKSTD